MPGRQEFTLPKVGRTHVLKVDGEEWVIKPRFSATFAVDQAAVDLGVVPDIPLTPLQQAGLGEAVVEHFLTEEQQAAFAEWPVERQTKAASWLLGVWNELRSGETDLEGDPDGPDPTPNSSESAKPSGSRRKSSSRGKPRKSTGGGKR